MVVPPPAKMSAPVTLLASSEAMKGAGFGPEDAISNIHGGRRSIDSEVAVTGRRFPLGPSGWRKCTVGWMGGAIGKCQAARHGLAHHVAAQAHPHESVFSLAR